MNMQESPEGSKRFLSIKVKFFGIYVIRLLAILVLISSVLPKIFTQYFVKEKTDELENLHQLIAEVLENEDFLQSPEAAYTTSGSRKDYLHSPHAHEACCIH